MTETIKAPAQNFSAQTTIQALPTVLAAHGIDARENIPLSRHTTFRIGGPAAVAAYPASPDALITVIRLCRASAIPYAVIGCGSNLLCPDEGFGGCAVFTTEMKQITHDGTTLTAAAGTPLAALCCTARDLGLSGLAFAYGIPGTLGGALYMNAGAYDGEIGDRVRTVTYYDPKTDAVHTVTAEECAFGYRTSRFQNTDLVLLSATLALEHGDRSAIRAEMEDITARRRDKQPLEYPSAGSAFKRYPGYFTAKLIDDAGLKGHRIGGAQVSEKHAGFIVNRGGATCADVTALIDHIRDRIRQEHSIEIEPEIRLLESCVVCIKPN